MMRRQLTGGTYGAYGVYGLLLPLLVLAPLFVGAPAIAKERLDTSCRRPPPKGVELPESPNGPSLSERLGLAQAWDLTEGAGVTVAVVDTGVDDRHPELAGSVDDGVEVATVAAKEEYRVQSTKAPALDCAGHGTAVAGLIAAHRGGPSRITGVAPQARVYPVRIVGGVRNVTGNTLAEAIDRAVDSGARVLNLSFALPVDREPVREAVQRAVRKDVVVVAAAGNKGDSGNKGNPGGSGESGKKTYPAAYEGVVAVAAVGANGEPMQQSNKGDWVDLAAYGEHQTVLASGGSGYTQVGGTSFAAPQVAGTAALVRSRFPQLTAEQVIERLVESAAPLGAGDDPATGAGLVDPFAALTSLEAGEDGASPAPKPETLAVQPIPTPEPLLSATGVAAVSWSGGLLFVVLMALLGAPAVRRAVRRRWRPGPLAGRSPAPHGNRSGSQRRTPPAVLEGMARPPAAHQRTGPRGTPAAAPAPPQRAARVARAAPPPANSTTAARPNRNP